MPASFPIHLPVKSLWRLTVLLIAVSASVWVLLAFFPELNRLRILQSQAAALSAEEAALEKRLDAARREHRWLQKEPLYLEAIARDRLDLYRPGETVYRIAPPDSSP